MNLKNGYKTLFEVIEDSQRVFLASKTNLFIDAEEIARFDIGTYKVVYQRGAEFFGIDAEGVETKLVAFDKIFIEDEEEVDVAEVTESDPATVDEPIMPAAEPELPSEDEDDLPEDEEEV